MNDLNQLADPLQHLLTHSADRIAAQCGLVRRQRHLTGARIAQALVLAHWTDHAPTQTQIRNAFAVVGASVTRQAVARRLDDDRAVEFLRQLLNEAVSQAVAEPTLLPVLSRFHAVILMDSSVVALPPDLVDIFRGGRSGRGRPDPAASVKLTVGLDLNSGRLIGPELGQGRAGDLTAAAAQASPPPGALLIADRNYFDLKKFARWNRDGAFWMSRPKCRVTIRGLDGTRWNLVERLGRAGANDVDEAVVLGAEIRVPCRLLARRVPPEVADLRQKRLRAKAADRGDPVSPGELALCGWTVLVTNVPADRLNVNEALTICRLRWQIELLFKLWKSGGGLGHWRGRKPTGHLCQLYSKLIMLVVRHWVLVRTCWSLPDRSLSKAAVLVRGMVGELMRALRSARWVATILRRLKRQITLAGRLDRRRRRPNAHDLLFCLGPEP